jgi:hypothetical protein
MELRLQFALVLSVAGFLTALSEQVHRTTESFHASDPVISAAELQMPLTADRVRTCSGLARGAPILFRGDPVEFRVGTRYRMVLVPSRARASLDSSAPTLHSSNVCFQV